MADDSDHGISGGLNSPSAIVKYTLAAFTALALANALELNVKIWFTFRRYRGLYFWSLNVASWGVIIYALSFIFKFFQVIKLNMVSVTFITLGWTSMVTGQSVVLYSRLHLILHDHARLRWVLIMIITNAVIFHTSTTVVDFGSNAYGTENWVFAYQIVEKIQVTVFSIQEFIISALYIYETKKILLPNEHFQKRAVQRTLRHLIYLNILIILMDCAIMGTEYADFYDIQTTMKGAVYGFKLRLEFTVLNQLMAVLQTRNASKEMGHTFSNTAQSDGYGGELALNSMHGTRRTRNNYSVFATTDAANLQPPKMNPSVIQKSTEVTISRTDAADDFFVQDTPGPPIQQAGDLSRSSNEDSAYAKPTNGRNVNSISSSEIELARAVG